MLVFKGGRWWLLGGGCQVGEWSFPLVGVDGGGELVCVVVIARWSGGWSFPLVGVDGGGEPVCVVACQVGSCSCSCCCQVTTVRLTAAAVVAIIRTGSCSPRVVEGGGGCQVVVVVVVNNNHVRSCLRVVKVGDGKKPPPSKMSIHVCSCLRVVVVVVAENKACKQNTVNEKYAGAPLHPLSLWSVSAS